MTGPPVHIVAANVGPDKKLPQNQPIQLAFDRLLLPDTVVRQSFILVDAFNTPLNPTVTYDPVTRIVTLTSPDLKVDQPYKIVITSPEGADDQSGVRAIDRATIDPSQNGQLGFQVTEAKDALPLDAQMDFCNDILPIFQEKCSASTCHGAPTDPPFPETPTTDGKTRPAAGLILETADGIRNTALGRVANGANRGALAGQGRAPGRVFGVDMPIIAPGNPANSWLVYKLLLATPEAYVPYDAGPDSDACVPPPTTEPTSPTTAYLPLQPDERARLANYVLGRQMPYTFGDALTERRLLRISAWIAQGAKLADCNEACPSPE